ncbi:hypothetical protein [Prosthecobacter sp.]|uniref:hypothetical protein n=1 Tax=Prosthecobacter sp. TaxID=1965333 RepID=UPI003783CF90
MKPLHWDSQEIAPWTGQKYTWDSPNPNVPWDGILEPGDPGYTPPPGGHQTHECLSAPSKPHA